MMMRIENGSTGAVRRLARMLLTLLTALMLFAGLSLLLYQLQVHARPGAEASAAALQVDKQVNEAVASPGDTLAYTITVRNSGDVSTMAWLTDTLPDGLTYVAGSLDAPFGTWGISDDTITWTAEMFGFNYTAVIAFSAEISTEEPYLELMNTASVTGSGELVEDSVSTISVADVGNLDTALTTKSVSSSEAEPGDIVTYTIHIENSDAGHPYLVPGVHLTDTIPSGMSYVPGSLSVLDPGAQYGVDSGVITWSNALEYLSFDEIRFGAEISSGFPRDTWVTNTAEIVAPLQSFTRSAGTYIQPDLHFLYLPAIFKRWPPVPYAPDLSNIYNPTNGGDYTVQWSYSGAHPDVTEPDTYTLQEATTADLSDWTTIYEGPNESFDYDDKSGGTYYYRVRGTNGYGSGAWSDVKSTAVYGEPYAPTLHEIDNEDEDVSYRVSWTYDESHPAGTMPQSYTLQEAVDDAFAEILRSFDPATDPECVVDAGGGYCDLDNDSGTYYYRVQGHNQAGTGPWSNTEDAYVWGYDDDFSDYRSGWPRKWEVTRGALYQVRPYEHPDCGANKDCKYEEGDGYVIARRAESKPYARFTPDEEIPMANYELEVDARWFEAEYRTTYEIFFSAEDDFDTYYSVKVAIENPKVNPLECSYQVYKQGDDEKLILHDFQKTDAIKCGVLHCGREGKGVDPDDPCGDTGWNEWKIEVKDGHIEVRVNGTYLGTWTDHDPFGPGRVFGVGATLYEGLTPSKPVFDNFEVELSD